MAVPACSKKRMKYILIHTWHPMQFTALRTLKPERRKFKNMLGMVFFSPASNIFEDFVDCMTKMGRSIGIWGAVVENILGSSPAKSIVYDHD